MINTGENGCQAGSPGPCYRVLIFAHAQAPFITSLLRGDVFFILSVMEFGCHLMSFQWSPMCCCSLRVLSLSRFMAGFRWVCVKTDLKACLRYEVKWTSLYFFNLRSIFSHKAIGSGKIQSCWPCALPNQPERTTFLSCTILYLISIFIINHYFLQR